MDEETVEDRAKLLSDYNAAVVSKPFGAYLGAIRIGHVFASPFHQQTTERSSAIMRSCKEQMNLFTWETLEEAEVRYVIQT